MPGPSTERLEARPGGSGAENPEAGFAAGGMPVGERPDRSGGPAVSGLDPDQRGPGTAVFLFARVFDSGLHQIANDGIHITPDISHFGKFGCFHLDEGRIGKLGQPASDFRFPYPGWPDHQNILRRDFLPQWIHDLLSAPTISERDSHGPLGGILSNDVFIQFLDDFPRGQLRHDYGSVVNIRGKKPECETILYLHFRCYSRTSITWF